MSIVKGMGVCLIPKADTKPCGQQIQEGEAIGTVVSGFNGKMPLMGHKRCADSFHARVQQSERAKRELQMQRIDQAGPGGPVDPTTAKDAMAFGSAPLEKPSSVTPPVNVIGDSTGVNFLGDLPEDATPDEAVAIANGEQKYFDREVEAAKNRARMSTYERPSQVQPARQTYLQGLVADTIPTVSAEDGRVTLASETGTLHLDPEDATDLMRLIEINADRARRQLR